MKPRLSLRIALACVLGAGILWPASGVDAQAKRRLTVLGYGDVRGEIAPCG